jgi:endonuclease/exonuclease/phosphatase family metal-dependent hydrolase
MKLTNIAIKEGSNMKKLLLLVRRIRFWQICITILFFSNVAGNSLEPKPQLTTVDLFFGSDSTFEVMTWNLEHFPKNDGATVDYVAKIAKYLDTDVIGLQEIESDSSFTNLIKRLNQIDSVNVWDGYRANSDKWEMNLAFLYKTNDVNVKRIYEIYEDDHYAFPRHPLVLELTFNDTPIVIINNHLKAKGGEKNEARRREASIKLNQYIEENFPNSNAIILGDLNDGIAEPKEQNVFWNFIEDSSDYMFTDMKIAADSTADWSYPYWPSHLDHILITNELFNEFYDKSSAIKTVPIDKYLKGGWDTYYEYITDHRPVALRLKFSE